MSRLGFVKRKKSSSIARFWIMLCGGFAGYYLGFGYLLKDYQLITYTPPEKDENGEPKKVPFRVSFAQTAPLRLTEQLQLKKELAEKKKLDLLLK